eukprot:g1733.t1
MAFWFLVPPQPAGLAETCEMSANIYQGIASASPRQEAMEEYEGQRIPLLGGGAGAGKGGGLSITTGLPLMEDDNFCRSRCCCVDSGCRKLDMACQLLCLKGKFCLGRPSITTTTGMPLLEDDNFLRVFCCFYDGGCRKFELACQLLCIKFNL